MKNRALVINTASYSWDVKSTRTVKPSDHVHSWHEDTGKAIEAGLALENRWLAEAYLRGDTSKPGQFRLQELEARMRNRLRQDGQL